MGYFARVAMAAGLICGLGIVAVPAEGQETGTAGTETDHSDNMQAHWLRDEQTGCRAPDPDFAEGDDIVWSGACVDGVVNGPGTLTFLNNGQPQVTISGTFRKGDLEPGHASLAWPDGSNYDGDQIGGKFNGRGVFVSAQQDRLEGEWKSGVLNGHAVVTWANGNRYDGGWLNGKAEGHGVETWTNGDRYDGEWHDGKARGHGAQVWANGQTYDGEWRDDMPNGTGKLVRSDGKTYTGKFVDGRPEGEADVATKALPATEVTAKAAPTAAPVAGALPVAAVAADRPVLPHGHFIDVDGKKLVAVDGSSIALSESEGGFARAIVKPDGVATTSTFTFVNDRMGTVVDANDSAHIAGFFKVTDAEIDIDYADGHFEVLRPSGGGVTLFERAPDGRNTCTAWYPEGHSFSESERKAALAEYASKLGVTLKDVDGNARLSSSACDAPPAVPTAMKSASVRVRNVPHPRPRPIQASFEAPAMPADIAASSPQQAIFVRTSQVHPIDAPKPTFESSAGGQSAVPAPAAMPAPAGSPIRAAVAAALPVLAVTAASPVASTTPADQPAALPAYQSDSSDPGASSCLSVTSNGSHWGFRNGCGYWVQFAYCLKSDSEPLASCKEGAIAGSAPPNSFSALVADASLQEKNVDHQFRWVACGGGAGEVVPKLDGIDPPVGHCLRARTAAK